MKVFFDDGNYNDDLNKLVAALDRFDKPMVVMPSEGDVKRARREYGVEEGETHVTFISFDYWISKKWVADDDYDHIDFFKVDKALTLRSYGVKTGCLTVDRTMKKRVTTEVEGTEEVSEEKGEE